jgi:hypothetical protein
LLRAEYRGPGRVAWNVTLWEGLARSLWGGGAVVLMRMKGVVARLALMRAARAVRSRAWGLRRRSSTPSPRQQMVIASVINSLQRDNALS